MNVASRELCEELFELSGWRHTEFFWQLDYYEDGSSLWNLYNDREIRTGKSVPAYDLSYMLVNMPRGVQLTHRGTQNGPAKDWLCRKNFGSYTAPDKGGRAFINLFYKEDDKPEQATAKLAIELFKQGILTKTESGDVS